MKLIIGQRVRVTNPKAHPRYVVLALSQHHVKLCTPNGRVFKLKRSRIERVAREAGES